MITYKLTPFALTLKQLGIADCTPFRGTEGSAGMDLSACLRKPLRIHAGETVKVPTGVCVFLGDNTFTFESLLCKLTGFYIPRSSIKGLQLENTVGVLDADYQGESFLKLYNKTHETIIVNPGDRLVQLVILPVLTSPWKKVDNFAITTLRGDKGDGSTSR